MKNFSKVSLLALSTALLPVFPQAGTLEAPKVSISGGLSGEAHMVSQKKNVKETNSINSKGKKGHGTNFYGNDGGLDFVAQGYADGFGESFGGPIEYELKFGLDMETKASNNPVLTTRMMVKNKLGSLFFGNFKGPEETLATGAYKVMGGSGGFDGTMYNNLNLSTGVVKGTDFTAFNSRATKVAYITHRYYGVQLGVSYAPNSKHRGGEAPNYTTRSDSAPFDANSLGAGVNFSHDFDNGVTFTTALTGITGNTKKPKTQSPFNNASLKTVDETANRHNTKAWDIGMLLEYAGFSFGLEYLDNGKSQQVKRSTHNAWAYKDAGKSYSAAVGYAFGPHKVAAGAQKTVRKAIDGKVRLQVLSGTYDHKIAPGLGVFVEYNNFRMRTTEAALSQQQSLYNANSTNYTQPMRNNSGHVSMLGMKVSF